MVTENCFVCVLLICSPNFNFWLLIPAAIDSYLRTYLFAVDCSLCGVFKLFYSQETKHSSWFGVSMPLNMLEGPERCLTNILLRLVTDFEGLVSVIFNLPPSIQTVFCAATSATILFPVLAERNTGERNSQHPLHCLAALYQDWKKVSCLLFLAVSSFREWPWSCFPAPLLHASLNRYISALLWKAHASGRFQPHLTTGHTVYIYLPLTFFVFKKYLCEVHARSSKQAVILYTSKLKYHRDVWVRCLTWEGKQPHAVVTQQKLWEHLITMPWESLVWEAHFVLSLFSTVHTDKELLRVNWNKTTTIIVFRGTFFSQIQLADLQYNVYSSG